MFRTSKKNGVEDLDSDTSLDKYGLDNDPTFSSSSSSSTSSTSKSSPFAALQPKKSFLRNSAAEVGRRPSNPLAKPDIRLSLVEDQIEKKDETPFSTMKFGSETLEEAQEKDEFFRDIEEKNENPDYGRWNKEFDLELSPTRPNLDQSKLLDSFAGKPHQISTPLHHQPSFDRVQESLSNILDEEIEEEEKKPSKTNHVTSVEPPEKIERNENLNLKLIDDLKRQIKDLQAENSHLKAKIESQSTKTTNSKPTSEQKEVQELENLLSRSQIENERLCKQIREHEQEKKQIKNSMIEENEKLRREILQIQQNNEKPTPPIVPVTSTVSIVPTASSNIQLNSLIHENQQLKNRQNDFERQIKELELINRRLQNNSTSQVSSLLHPSIDRAEIEFKLTKTEEILRQRDLHIENLTKQFENLQTKRPTSSISLKRDVETIKTLRDELQKKNSQLDKLRALYDAVNVQHKSLLAEREREKSRSATKTYQPDRFIQSAEPIEVLREENSQLKHLVEKLEENSRREHFELRRDFQTTLKEKDDEIVRLRQKHQNDVQKLLVEFSTNENENRSSELMKKVESNEKIIAQLQKSLENANEKAREVSILRVRDDEMKSTIERLERQLRDAENFQTPEMKHFRHLENQIEILEKRLSKREDNHRNYETKIRQNDFETNENVEKLHAIIKQKNNEIERFRTELDSMLKLLKTLKFQQMFSVK